MNEKEILEKNSLEANKSMAFVSVVIAGVLFIFWLLCLFGINFFSFSPSTMRYALISMPIDIAFLITPICFIKTEQMKRPGFKYFVVTLFICVVAAINLVLPKEGILLWAACIAVASLYFDPKTTKYAFILTLVMLTIVTPLSAIYGNWDSSLMGASKVEFEYYTHSDGITHLNIDSRADRIYWLSHYSEITGGDLLNRWAAMFGFFYLPRALALAIIFVLTNGLSRRTKIMQNEHVDEAKSIQKMSSELNIASAIQSSVLPSEFPDSSRCELFAMMDPAKEIGGDFYDFFKIDDDHAAMVIGDVSGKGVPASLFMMKTQAVIRAFATSIKNNPAKILEESNKSICDGNEMNMFVTCWFGILDLNNGELNFASAGHNPPIVKIKGKYQYLKSKNGLVLGGFDGSKYFNDSVKFSKGDKLFIYTDGVTEAHNPEDELYGELRLLKFLEEKDLSPVDAIVNVREDVKKFANGREQFDDITMLCVEYHKPQSVFAKKFLASRDNLPKVQEFVINSAKNIEFTKKDINMLNIAIEEIFVNIASYSFEDYGRVDVGVNSENNRLTLIFMDNGKPFNPLDREDPNVALGAEDRGIGGLGIYMVKNLMDKVYYEYKDGRNILTLIKNY